MIFLGVFLAMEGNLYAVLMVPALIVWLSIGFMAMEYLAEEALACD